MREDRKEFIKKLTSRILNYSVNVVHFVDSLPRDLSSQILARQLIRSATSIGANFTEAQGASSTKDFTNFLFIALKSANETRYWLSILVEVKKGNRMLTQQLYRETTEFANILGSIVNSLRKKV